MVRPRAKGTRKSAKKTRKPCFRQETAQLFLV